MATCSKLTLALLATLALSACGAAGGGGVLPAAPGEVYVVNQGSSRILQPGENFDITELIIEDADGRQDLDPLPEGDSVTLVLRAGSTGPFTISGYFGNALPPRWDSQQVWPGQEVWLFYE